MTDRAQPVAELDTWREIAAYLRVSVREAQTWEKKAGMPVHRMPGKKSRVKAYCPELDAWKRQVAPTRGDSSVGSISESRPPAPALGHQEDENADLPTRRLGRRTLLGALGGVAALSVAGTPWLFRRHAAVPMRAGVVGNTLYAWDTAGREIWKYAFADPVRDRKTEFGMLRLPERTVQIADLYGDGAKQILFAARFSQGTDRPFREELFCFSPEGKLLWRYAPEITLTFGDTRFSGPWCLSDMLVAASGRHHVVWLALAHWNWRPGAVVALDPQGRATVRFVNAGHIYALGHVSDHARNYIMAGGVNNEYECAALAVFNEDAAPCSSPQSRGTRFECVDGPKGQPDRYFLFPPSELTIVSDKPYNQIIRIDPGNKEVFVQTNEIPGETEAKAMYRFSESMEPLDVAFDDAWAACHRRLQQEGKLGHSLADCPHVKSPTVVRRWEPKSGWTTLSVSPSSSVRPDAYRG